MGYPRWVEDRFQGGSKVGLRGNARRDRGVQSGFKVDPRLRDPRLVQSPRWG